MTDHLNAININRIDFTSGFSSIFINNKYYEIFQYTAQRTTLQSNMHSISWFSTWYCLMPRYSVICWYSPRFFVKYLFCHCCLFIHNIQYSEMIAFNWFNYSRGNANVRIAHGEDHIVTQISLALCYDIDLYRILLLNTLHIRCINSWRNSITLIRNDIQNFNKRIYSDWPSRHLPFIFLRWFSQSICVMCNENQLS